MNAPSVVLSAARGIPTPSPSPFLSRLPHESAAENFVLPQDSVEHLVLPRSSNTGSSLLNEKRTDLADLPPLMTDTPVMCMYQFLRLSSEYLSSSSSPIRSPSMILPSQSSPGMSSHLVFEKKFVLYRK